MIRSEIPALVKAGMGGTVGVVVVVGVGEVGVKVGEKVNVGEGVDVYVGEGEIVGDVVGEAV